MTLKERTDAFIQEYKLKGYHISKHHTIKEKKVNDYGKEYEYPIAEVVSIRVPVKAGNTKEFLYVLIFRKGWFNYAYTDEYYGNEKIKGKKYLICDHRIFQWIRHVNRPTETIITLCLPDSFKYSRWYEIIRKASKIIDGRMYTTYCPEAFQVPKGRTEVCLVSEDLFIDVNPYDVVNGYKEDSIIGEEIDLNSYL